MQLDFFDFTPTTQTTESFNDLCRSLGVESGPNWSDRFGASLNIWATSSIKTPIKTLSLFSGAGGLDIAFHDAGFSIESAVEIDERFASTLKINSAKGGYLEGTEIFCMDVRKFDLPKNRQIDFIIGGPPCQSFSAAGRRAAGVQGTQDDRGILFQEYVRLLKTLKPRAFLFENVYGITGAEQGKAWKLIQKEFKEAGYNIKYRILDAADYGVPQHRERLFIVGCQDGNFMFPAPTHGPNSSSGLPYIGAATAIEGVVSTNENKAQGLGGRFGHLLEQVPPGLNYSFFTEKMGHPQPIFAWRSKFSDFLYKADPNTPVRTIKAQGGQYTGPFHWENRPFTVSELKRLQSFPDSYSVHGGRQVAIHQIGNSVPPQIARILAISILQQIFSVPLPSYLPLLSESVNLNLHQRKRNLTSSYQKKASMALDGNMIDQKKINPRPNLEPLNYIYKAKIINNLKLEPCENGPMHIDVCMCKENWIFKIDSKKVQSLETSSKFEILISSDDKYKWALDVKKVILVGDLFEKDNFIGAWKAFENELVKRNIKADLVQLSEYYQYRPRFSCKMKILEYPDAHWKILQKVVESVGTREILSSYQIAKLWEIEEQDILDHVLWLRTLGYEVRNNNTNPQIPSGSYLIPYTFPTLNTMSVQARKSLVKT